MSCGKVIKIIVILFFTADFAGAQNGGGDSLSVEQAVKLVIENHPAIQEAVQGISSSSALVEQSRSGYYPDVTGDASYARIGPVPSIDLPGGSADLYPKDNYDAHVSLRQTIYDFGKRANSVDLARTGLKSANDYLEMVKSNLSYQVVQVFYSILFLRDNIAVIDDQIRAFNEHLSFTRKKAQTGSATDFDVLTTEVKIAAAQSRRVDVENALRKQEDNFRRLTGMASDDPVLLKEGFRPRDNSVNTDSLIALAKNQLPEAKLSKNAEEKATVRRKLASLGNRPSLKVDLQYGFKNGYFPDLNTLKGNWVAGLQLQSPIFDGYRTKNKVRQADAELNSAREHTRDVENQITLNVKQAVSDLEASRKKLKTSEPQVIQAEQAVTIAEARYTAGTATNLDLLDAETSLADARLIRLRALYELVSSQYALDKAVGNKIW